MFRYLSQGPRFEWQEEGRGEGGLEAKEVRMDEIGGGARLGIFISFLLSDRECCCNDKTVLV